MGLEEDFLSIAHIPNTIMMMIMMVLLYIGDDDWE
jgi:hypothetical protein